MTCRARRVVGVHAFREPCTIETPATSATIGVSLLASRIAELGSMDSERARAAQVLALRERAKRTAVAVIEESANQLSIGCCTLFARDDRKFVVTAQHVAEAIERGDVGLAIGETQSEIWTPGCGQLAWASQYDVSVMELNDAEFLERLHRASYREFLDDRDVHVGTLPGDFMLYGYPAEGLDVSGDELTAKPVMLTTCQFVGAPQGLKRPRAEHDLFLAWTGDDTEDLTGISGTPVWAVTNGPEQGGTVWTPDQSMKLCAVETSVLRGEWIRASGWAVVDAVISHLAQARK